MVKYTHKKRKAIAETKPGPTLSRAQEGELKWLRDAFQSLGRRTTTQAYEIGGYLVRAKSILPEKALGAWIKVVCKFTPKAGRNYMAVHTNLMDYKERLEAAAVAPTVLFVLAYAEQPDVERVISAIEAGEELTVAQVKAMVGAVPTKKAKNEAVLDVGGMAGLRKIAEIKVEEDSVKFLQLTTGILKRVEKAMEPLAQNRAVFKGPLQELIIDDCKHAHDLINSIAAPLQPAMVASVNWRPARLTEGTTWRKVQELLSKMGGAHGWPGREDFVPWLQAEVIPLLRFVVHGEALQGDADGEDRADAAAPLDKAVDDGPLAFDDMPSKVQETVENALEIVSPERRDEIRSQIVFDPKPLKRQYKTLAA
ncbi:hypothetical protein [Ensifer sp.]|uniref:hypothetical protein n=1 Tax=Ensifer sp. TaxID=1872086 RepID=UPI00289D6874|nr:hypothetical protein [Ensifer sp.]